MPPFYALAAIACFNCSLALAALAWTQLGGVLRALTAAHRTVDCALDGDVELARLLRGEARRLVETREPAHFLAVTRRSEFNRRNIFFWCRLEGPALGLRSIQCKVGHMAGRLVTCPKHIVLSMCYEKTRTSWRIAHAVLC